MVVSDYLWRGCDGRAGVMVAAAAELDYYLQRLGIHSLADEKN